MNQETNLQNTTISECLKRVRDFSNSAFIRAREFECLCDPENQRAKLRGIESDLTNAICAARAGLKLFDEANPPTPQPDPIQPPNVSLSFNGNQLPPEEEEQAVAKYLNLRPAPPESRLLNKVGHSKAVDAAHANTLHAQGGQPAGGQPEPKPPTPPAP